MDARQGITEAEETSDSARKVGEQAKDNQVSLHGDINCIKIL